MAPHNKLLLRDSAGATMVERAVDAALASRACGVWVVIGHQAESIAFVLGSRSVQPVYAAGHASGLASSLGRGIAALPNDVAAALICLGDMPEVTSVVLDRIIDAYGSGRGRPIVVPIHLGQRGNPVLWPRRFFPDILALTGDNGARALFGRHAAETCEVEVGSPSVLRDFDTPDESSDWR